MKTAEVGSMHRLSGVEKNAVVVKTGGGNAPLLMGLRALDHLNMNFAARRLPPVYGVFPTANDRQIRMLRSEASSPANVLIDSQYAQIVEPFVSTHGRLNDHISTVVAKSVETKRALMLRFGPNAEPFGAMSLGLQESVTIDPRDIIGVLDAGSRYPSIDHPEHYFFFPVLASQLWQSLRKEQLNYDPLLRVDDTSLKNAIKTMTEVERGYKRIYLSLINSFSYRSIPEGVTDVDGQFEALQHQPKTHLRRPIFYTPPMSPNTSGEMPTDDVVNPSIFVMFSGTGSSITETNQLIPQIVAAGYDVIVPESALRFGDVTEENMPLVQVASSPSIIFHPNVHGVVARPGFGTVWDDENAGIETMRPPFTQGDDYEMVVNAKTLDALGLGQELVPGEVSTPEDFRRARVLVYYRAQTLKEKQIENYGTKDGLKLIAGNIAQNVIKDNLQSDEEPVELSRELLWTDAYEIQHISPYGFTMETDQVLSWYDLANSFNETGELSEKQRAWVDEALRRDSKREGTWKYALRNVRQLGDRLLYDVGSQPFGIYETVGDPTDPEELLALASPHGNATILITKDNKIIVQKRKAWNQETNAGNFFYGGIPGASIANLHPAERGETSEDGRNIGKPKPFGNAEIENDISSRAQREIGLSGEHITSIETVAFIGDHVRVHTEAAHRAKTDLTSDEIIKLPQSEKNDINGFAEEFFTINASSAAIRTLVTEMRIPLPPTHTAAFVAVGYSLRYDESIAQGFSTEESLQAANRWLRDTQQGVRDNLGKINARARVFWANKTLDQMRPNGGKDHRNTTGFDPGYSALEQGLPTLDDELIRLQFALSA